MAQLLLLWLLFSLLVISNSLWSHGLQHSRPPYPSPSPRVCPSSCTLHQWPHPTMSSSDALSSFCPQSFTASGNFPVSQLFTSGDQNPGASASVSVLPVNIQGWFPLRLTGLISLLSKDLSGVFSSESAVYIRWPKYWSFSFSISPSNEYSGLISIKIDWFDLLSVQGTLKSLLQHHCSKASILQDSVLYGPALTSIRD